MSSVTLTTSAVPDTAHITSTTWQTLTTPQKVRIPTRGLYYNLIYSLFVAEDGSDDEDSYEAQLRRQDQYDFRMDNIDAGHEERLRTKGPYRIPPPSAAI